MSNTVYFKGKDGQITSMRTGNSHLRLTSYLGSTKGGVTFLGPHMTSRMDNKGQSLGIGLKTGNSTTYMGKYGTIQNRLTPF